MAKERGACFLSRGPSGVSVRCWWKGGKFSGRSAKHCDCEVKHALFFFSGITAQYSTAVLRVIENEFLEPASCLSKHYYTVAHPPSQYISLFFFKVRRNQHPAACFCIVSQTTSPEGPYSSVRVCGLVPLGSEACLRGVPWGSEACLRVRSIVDARGWTVQKQPADSPCVEQVYPTPFSCGYV